jgi:cyclopropane fatty-acyl-phospholipid synthase-like methyltransferase
MSSLADQADKYLLYEQAVQCVEAEIDMVDASFERIRGYAAQTLREDFCGTAQTSIEWIQRRPDNIAIGVDLDEEVLAWSNDKHLDVLMLNQRERIELLEEDVRELNIEPVQIVLAMNFSYQLFDTRQALREYFTIVKQGLSDDGIFFLDAFGGYDCYKEIEETTVCDGFDYMWDQASYNPIDGGMQCYIHFVFPDGSRLDRAFSYYWRMWTLPELQELLEEAGFVNVTVYWEGTDEETGQGDGVYTPAKVGDADPAWVCYLSAEK